MVQLFAEAVHAGIKNKVPFVVGHRVGLLQLVEELSMQGKMPDKEWLLICLAKVPGCSCPLFAKGYQPPKRKPPNRTDVQMPNQDAFFTGLNEVSAWKTGANQFRSRGLSEICIGKRILFEPLRQSLLVSSASFLRCSLG